MTLKFQWEWSTFVLYFVGHSCIHTLGWNSRSWQRWWNTWYHYRSEHSGCGVPLQAMLLLVMPHREGKHWVMTKEIQVGETEAMKHPKQREVRYFKCACCFNLVVPFACCRWCRMGGGCVVLLNITFSVDIYFTAFFQRQSAIITWRCWKWLHSVTVFEELGILRETEQIGNCIVAGKCN